MLPETIDQPAQEERGEVEERYNPTCTNRTSSFFVSCSVTERERKTLIYLRFYLNLRSSDVIANCVEPEFLLLAEDRLKLVFQM